MGPGAAAAGGLPRVGSVVLALGLKDPREEVVVHVLAGVVLMALKVEIDATLG